MRQIDENLAILPYVLDELLSEHMESLDPTILFSAG